MLTFLYNAEAILISSWFLKNRLRKYDTGSFLKLIKTSNICVIAENNLSKLFFKIFLSKQDKNLSILETGGAFYTGQVLANIKKEIWDNKK